MKRLLVAAVLVLVARAAEARAGAAGAPSRSATVAAPILLDDFETPSAWSPMPASGVEMKLAPEPGPHGNALRVDFDFHGGGGYAVLHRKLDLELPANYRFEFWIRGETQPQNLEFKLLDASGENVWWCNRVNHEFPREWTTERVRKRQIAFAWGPKGGAEVSRAAAIEIAITAGSGGKGTVWLNDLSLVPMSVPGAPPPPVASASSAAGGHPPAAALDTLPSTWWESRAGDREPAWTVDLGTSREFGGLVLDWRPGLHATSYAVEFDDGDGRWRVAREVRSSDGGRDWLELPESETRRVRIRARTLAADRVALARARIMPLEWSASPERFLMAVAADCPRGHYPRAFLGQQSYWTVVGADGDPDEGLLDEDGRLEVGRGEFSLEPFLLDDRGLRTWADGTTMQRLAKATLPMPTVTRSVDSLELSVTAFARTERDHSYLVARYHLKDRSGEDRRVMLLVAIRPLQVNPPSQLLNVPGGPARIATLAWDGSDVLVNGERHVHCEQPPDRFGAIAFDDGDLVAQLAAREIPHATSVEDPTGRASGVLAWTIDVPADTDREVQLVIPFGAELAPPSDRATIADWWSEEDRRWQAKLGTLKLGAHGPGAEVSFTLRAQLGYVLVNRDGPALQPGSRAYERSWIRDGALMSSALLRAGMADPVRDYLVWYAAHQYANGKVPCCVDRRGSDPVPEHDSHGELVFLAAEYLRLTRDRATAEAVYPHVRAAVAYLDTLRAQRRTDEWRTSANAPYFGLLPPSISHEGYSAKPMHSYWDDLFALRGYRDGAWLAAELGHAQDARWMGRSRDEFAHDLAASMEAAMRAHAIDYVPGCADLGDFDATSTTIALSPVQAEDVLPDSALQRTFERYWEFFRRRRFGREPWDAYTPYELRNVGAFVRLGWRDRANELLDWFMKDRRPAGWRQWAEVVDRDPRHARFIGDMPHTWVGTDFVRSVQEMLVYERESDSSLVIAAGVPDSWVGEDGLQVSGLRTRWGPVGYALRRTEGGLALTLDSSLLRTPPGGIEFAPPVTPAKELAAGVTAAVSVDDHLVPLAAGDTRFRWRPSAQQPGPPRTLEWGHRIPARTGALDGR